MRGKGTSMKIEGVKLRLYAVTDRAWAADEDALMDQIAAAIDGGAGIVQLREKHLDHDAFLQEAERFVALCREKGVISIINDAVDIAAAGGTDIWAAKSGVVLTSTYNSSYGNYVVISHANGESTLYAHMSKRLVSEGDKVTQGQTIGLVGTTGSSTGNHLHFEVRLNGQRQDPLNYFRGSTFTLRASGKSVSYTVS